MSVLDRVVAAYALIGVLTFGYASNAEWPSGIVKEAQPFGAALNGIICGMVWPLYLSHKVFDGVRK